MKPRAWNRLQWGVLFHSERSEKPILIGSLWMDADECGVPYVGEPTRVLMFTTRAAARAWCRNKNSQYAKRELGDLCRDWRFTPVRVRETVRVVDK